MIFPFGANKIEQLELDPEKIIEGFVWYNKVEKVYKTYIDGIAHVFVTDKAFEDLDNGIIAQALARHQFTVSFTDAYQVIIKHNKGKTNFNYNVYDAEENCNLACSVEIIDENEISVDFVDPVTGHIFMYFE